MNEDEFKAAIAQMQHSHRGPFHSYVLNFDKTITPLKYLALFFNRLLAIANDVCEKPIKKLRILDLGSYEGVYSIGFAQLGAEVVSVEGRPINYNKMVFAKDFLKLKNLKTILADVRTIKAKEYGTFDLVLSCGLMYHLDAPSVFEVTENIFEMANRAAVLDTHFALSRPISHIYKGRTYWGKLHKEFEPGTPGESKEVHLANSLDNNDSFWLTKISWLNLLKGLGFSTVYESLLPQTEKELGYYDRITMVALKNEKRHDFFKMAPSFNIIPEQIGEMVPNCQGGDEPTVSYPGIIVR